MSFPRWTSFTNQTNINENALLLEYWKEVGGLIFAEVYAYTRRIDGVRFASSPEKNIVTYRRAEFLKAVFSESMIEVIEVKSELNRGLIGQAVVGAVLLEMEYGIAPERIKKVVVCRDTDLFLEDACKKLDIKVWSPKN